MPTNHEGRPLRLTLRTLLAWLDDTLPAAEVRQIGNQVTESTFAKELVEKIQRVTRRRRLTVPSSTGADATDPNVVASYLDNELSAEQVAEYEKRCLTSDVHLAEVASCHQILSMIGQKAKVPAEARHRMYRLVRGRESVARDVPRTFVSPSAERDIAPVPEWSTPASREASSVPSWALPAAAALLVVLMATSAWMLAPASRDSAPPQAATAPQPKPKPGGPPAVAVLPAPELPPADEIADAPEKPAAVPAPEASPEKGLGAGAAAASAVVGPHQGVLLRWNPEERSWQRIEAGATLSRDDRVVGLAPFWSELRFGPEAVVLIESAEIRVETSDPDGTPRFELVSGRVLLRGGADQERAVVLAGDRPLTLSGVAGRTIGLERRELDPSADPPAVPGLRVYHVEGPVSLKAGSAEETLSGPGILEFTPPDGLAEAGSRALPAWVTASAPAEVDRLSGEAFRSFFKADTPTTRALLEASEADEEAVRTLAVKALGTVGAVEMVLRALNRKNDAPLRRAAIEVLRDWGRRDDESRKLLRVRLAEFGGGEDWATTVEGLLAEPTAEEAEAPATYSKLVKLLEHPDVGVRQLALDRLMTLTGRDALGYDPDDPKGAALRAWQDLVRNGAAPKGR
jgi:hypothetical protein